MLRHQRLSTPTSIVKVLEGSGGSKKEFNKHSVESQSPFFIGRPS